MSGVETTIWVSAAEAVAILGVKRATLYAYASRGKVRTHAIGKTSRYLLEDLQRLRARRAARAGHGALAAAALQWGEPVLDTRVTRMESDGPRYRGRSTLELARASTFESVAELLWNADESVDANGAQALSPGVVWELGRWPIAASKVAGLIGADVRPVDAMVVALPLLALRDAGRFHAQPDATREVARRMVRLMAASLGLPRGAAVAQAALRQPDVVRVVACALGLRPRPVVLRAISSSLVICADHGLNPSSFAARIAASVGADVYACVSAALATFSGPGHGGMATRVAALVHEIGRAERAPRVVAERLRRGDEIPGFGHPLYPEGDPRCGPLLQVAQAVSPRGRATAIVEALVDTMALAGGQAPNLDVGLAAVAGALGLGPGGGPALFAIGRAAGWVAQVLEQRETGTVLRPRARYVGR